MSNYRRAKEAGATYFFTVVTYERQNFLCELESRKALRAAIEKAKESHPFRIDAWVLLPDHLHCIWTLPESESDFSIRWAVIKRTFTKNIQLFETTKINGTKRSDSRKKRGESLVWQRRFWEHLIRDQDDFNQHCDYIHYNPVKHSLVEKPGQWPYSTFHRFVRSGLYPENWGDSLSEITRKMDRE